MSLRDYQAECLDAIRKRYVAGVRRQLVVMSTGLGKSHLQAYVPGAVGMFPALYLVHNEELIEQHLAHWRRTYNGTFTISVEQADREASLDSDCVIACVPTLVRKDKEGRRRRLEKFPPHHFSILMPDESHLDLSPGRLAVIRHFQPKLLLGATATPFRGDGKPLSRIYDEVVFQRDIQWGIEHGYLSRIRAMRVYSKTDITNVKSKADDFDEEDLAKAINTDFRNSLICSAIEQHAEGRRAVLIFSANKMHAEALVKQLVERGHTAQAILDHTRKDDRRRWIEQFRRGELRHLVTVTALATGFDAPICDCIVMGRPIKSPLLFTQSIGRGVRLHDEKSDVLLIDVVDICGTHKLQSVSALFGVRDFDALGGDVLEIAKKAQKVTQLGLALDDGLNANQIEEHAKIAERIAEGTLVIDTEAQAIDLFNSVEVAEEVDRDSVFAWLKATERRYAISAGGGRRITLWEDAAGAWCLTDGKETLNFGPRNKPPFKDADRAIKRWLPGEWRKFSLHAGWRNDPATPKQIERLKQMGVRAIPPNLTKGNAGLLLDRMFAARRG